VDENPWNLTDNCVWNLFLCLFDGIGVDQVANTMTIAGIDQELIPQATAHDALVLLVPKDEGFHNDSCTAKPENMAGDGRFPCQFALGSPSIAAYGNLTQRNQKVILLIDLPLELTL
jgi:hypothetical protein